MMKSRKIKYLVSSLIIASVLILDQIVKIWVKTHMCIGDEIPLIGNWCRLHFVENIGMAFGMAFGGLTGKLLLTIFRLLASAAILWFLLSQIKKKSPSYLFVVSLSLIFVGAVGNLVDSCFYGIIFSESSPFQTATLFPHDGGYSRFMCGKVVDMFYFPLFEFAWPQWMPWIGGSHFEFFNAIFNVADAAVTIGVIILIFDQIFSKSSDNKEDMPVEQQTNASES